MLGKVEDYNFDKDSSHIEEIFEQSHHCENGSLLNREMHHNLNASYVNFHETENS